ncbi:hypothetical protein [Streptomyces sp. NPDC057636]
MPPAPNAADDQLPAPAQGVPAQGDTDDDLLILDSAWTVAA